MNQLSIRPAPIDVPVDLRDPAPSTPNVLSPFRVRGLTLRNRIVMPPMGTNFALPDGTVSDHQIAYYGERARGGVGLIIVENACVTFPAGSNGTTQLRLDHDRYIPRLWELTETIHSYGAKAAIQINHSGGSANPSRTGTAARSSSDVPSKPGAAAPSGLNVDEIASIVADYAAAARRAQRAGFDVVEIHAGHSYLISEFLSPYYNKRTDDYGGSPENRARILSEVLDATRAAVGPRMPVFIRVSADELVQGGNTLEDTVEILGGIADKVDVIDVSAALAFNLQYQIDRMDLPDGWRSGMAARVREATGRPTITSGNIRDPRVAEEIVAEGRADLVAIGRGLIADPHWVRKLQAGCADQIVDCISCNIGCADHRIRLDRPIRCTVNPDVIGTHDHHGRRVTRPTVVAVAGGGVGGLEAACTAAEVGCRVTLFEARETIGGRVGDAVRLPQKRRIAGYLAFLAQRAARAGVDIRVNSPVDAQGLEAIHPDVVVTATGSEPAFPPVPGLRERVDQEGTRVFSIAGMLDHLDQMSDEAGKDVVVVGAGAVGLDVVEHLTQVVGAHVTLVEMAPAIGSDLDLITRLQMVEMIEKNAVTVLTSTALQSVGDGFVTVRDMEGREWRIQAAATFVCLGMRPVQDLWTEAERLFRSEGTVVVNLGDSSGVGKIIDATAAGRGILAVLEDIGALESA